MTEQQHPITPPTELVREWAKGCSPYDVPADHIATHAARWGADQELEACVTWMKTHLHSGPNLSKQLRTARRPKPPSLAEQAMQEINVAECYMDSANVGYDFTAVHRALERLQELENND